MQCLVIDTMHPDLGSRLQELGMTMDYRPGINRATLLEVLAGFPVLICRTRIMIDEEVLSAAPNLRLIVRAGAGLDDIDLAAAERHGVLVLNAPEGNRDAVAEHTVGLLLALLNKIPQAHISTSSFFWERETHRGNEVLGKVVSIIGYGNMGQATAARLSGFGCQVLAYDKYLDPWPQGPARRVSLEQVQQHSDIILLHLPLTTETNHFIDEAFWQKLQKPVWLVNTARGAVVHTAALVRAIRSGKVLGAALDVLENENLASFTAAEREQFTELASFPQVILTPHVAGWTHESYQRINQVVVMRLREWLLQQSEKMS